MHRPRLVSVIIPVLNAGSTFGRQLGALSTQDYDGEWEVVIADNGSSDDTLRVAEGLRGNLAAFQIVDASRERGASFARAVGTKAAAGDLLVYCDADDVVTPTWLSAMVEAAVRADLVAGRPCWDRLRDPTAGWQPAERRWTGHLGQHHFLPAATSASLGIWRDVLNGVGGWDVDLKLSGADTDLSWRVQLAGFDYLYAPEAVVDKRERPTLWTHAVQEFRRGIGDVQLHAKFRRLGKPGSDLVIAIRTWGSVFFRLPFAVWSDDRRAVWVTRAARAAGRLIGSIRFGTLYL